MVIKFLYVNFKQKYKGRKHSLKDLMLLHRQFFRIKQNLHDLYCCGLKNYIEALRNVEDYNLSIVLERKVSIPSINEVFNEAECHWDLFYSIQMDIENYNYVDILLTKSNEGHLNEEERKNEVKKFNKEQEDKNKPKMNAGVVFLTPDKAPNGMNFHRKNIEFMNNFFVDIVTYSFTNI